MGIRSDVAFRIQGNKEKIDFVNRWLMSKFEELLPNEYEPVEIYLGTTDKDQIDFYIEAVKWYQDSDYAMLFNLIWRFCERIGLDGKFIELCYEYPDTENNPKYINSGENLTWPNLVMRIE